jgi:hypothetical protein
MKPPLRSSFRLWPAVFLLAGCRSTHSPTVDVFGSYFPAWIICIVAGLLLTVIARQIFLALKISGYLRPGPVVYLSLLIGFTLAVWLSFFKN